MYSEESQLPKPMCNTYCLEIFKFPKAEFHSTVLENWNARIHHYSSK